MAPPPPPPPPSLALSMPPPPPPPAGGIASSALQPAAARRPPNCLRDFRKREPATNLIPVTEIEKKGYDFVLKGQKIAVDNITDVMTKMVGQKCQMLGNTVRFMQEEVRQLASFFRDLETRRAVLLNQLEQLQQSGDWDGTCDAGLRADIEEYFNEVAHFEAKKAEFAMTVREGRDYMGASCSRDGAVCIRCAKSVAPNVSDERPEMGLRWLEELKGTDDDISSDALLVRALLDDAFAEKLRFVVGGTTNADTAERFAHWLSKTPARELKMIGVLPISVPGTGPKGQERYQLQPVMKRSGQRLPPGYLRSYYPQYTQSSFRASGDLQTP